MPKMQGEELMSHFSNGCLGRWEVLKLYIWKTNGSLLRWLNLILSHPGGDEEGKLWAGSSWLDKLQVNSIWQLALRFGGSREPKPKVPVPATCFAMSSLNKKRSLWCEPVIHCVTKSFPCCWSCCPSIPSMLRAWVLLGPESSLMHPYWDIWSLANVMRNPPGPLLLL